MSAALKCIFALLVIASLSEATTNDTETFTSETTTTTTTLSSTTLTSTTTVSDSNETTTVEADETTTEVANEMTTEEAESSTSLQEKETTTDDETSTTLKDKETDLDNRTSTTLSEANETANKTQKEPDANQTENASSETTTATTTSSATRTSFSEGEGLKTEAVATVRGSILLSVSSPADAEQLAADQAVTDGWRAAIARAAGVASEQVELMVSVEPAPDQESRLRAGSAGALTEGAAQLSLSYVIRLSPAASKAEAQAGAGEVGAAIAATPPATLAASLAEEASKATGGRDFGVQVQSIRETTEEVVLRLVTATQTTTTTAAAVTQPAPETSLAPPARLPGLSHALATAAAVVAWSL